MRAERPAAALPSDTATSEAFAAVADLNRDTLVRTTLRRLLEQSIAPLDTSARSSHRQAANRSVLRCTLQNSHDCSLMTLTIHSAPRSPNCSTWPCARS